MLVDVVLMRAGGKKLSNEALRAATPMRGELTVRLRPYRATPDSIEQKVRFALLSVDGPEVKHLYELREPVINSIVGTEMVIVGIEQDYRVDLQHQVEQPQGWWCRVVSAASQS